jgi:inosine-uridine nucleoside N-ribohydrolase
MAGRLEGKPEYNVWCDHGAARIVLQQVNPRLVGLEASSETLPQAEVEALLSPADPAEAFLLDCYRAYRGERERAPLTLFDPITVLSVLCPEAFNFQSLRVLVECEGRLRLTDDGAEVRYALSSDWPRLRPRIVRQLEKRKRQVAPRPAAA